MKKYSLIIISLLLITGCQKKSNVTPDAANVSITLTSPQEAHTYAPGDTVHIVATVSYPSELHGYELKITDSATGNIAYDMAEHVHNDHFDIATSFVYSDTMAKTYQLSLSVEVDHNGTEAVKQVSFHYHY